MKIFSRHARLLSNRFSAYYKRKVRHLSQITISTCLKSGVTLIEVMVALLILAVMVVMLATSLRHPRAIVVKSTLQQAAIQAANEALEEAVAAGYMDSFDNRLRTVPSGNVTQSNYRLHGHVVSGTRVVSEWDSEVPPTLLIGVTVNYPGSEGDSVVMETLLAP